MSQENLSRKEKIKLLEEFIQRVSNSKELKRGLAVKLALEGYTYNAIKEILVVSIGFISKWKTAFEFGSIKALKLQHKGSTGYLNREEKEETVEWIINQEAWDISELESYLIEKYDVVFKSRQSYYDILKIARLRGASHVGISINTYEALWSKKGKIDQKLTEEMSMIQLSAEKQQELDEHILAISRILYEHTEAENLKTFETIEREVREQMLDKVTPQIGEFFFQKGGEKEGGSKEV